jgi:hypothetical protein
MDAARSYETLLKIYQITRRHISEDNNLHISRCENLSCLIQLLKQQKSKRYECGFVTGVAKVSIEEPCDNILKFESRKQRLAHVCRHTLPKGQILYMPFMCEEGVLGRTNRLLSFHTTGTAVGKSLPSCYLATVGETHRQSHRLAFDKTRTT